MILRKDHTAAKCWTHTTVLSLHERAVPLRCELRVVHHEAWHCSGLEKAKQSVLLARQGGGGAMQARGSANGSCA